MHYHIPLLEHLHPLRYQAVSLPHSCDHTLMLHAMQRFIFFLSIYCRFCIEEYLNYLSMTTTRCRVERIAKYTSPSIHLSICIKYLLS